MILLDVNVLVYAHRPESSPVTGVTEWLESALSSGESVAVWDVILASAYRILTHPKFFSIHENRELAAEEVLDFLSFVRDNSIVVSPGPKYWPMFLRIVKSTNATGNMVTDAGIAVLAIERNCRLATFDRDFERFPGLNWFRPI